MRRRPRKLAADEADLWRRVAETAEPLHPRRTPGPPPAPGPDAAPPRTPPPETAPPPAAPTRPFRIGERATAERRGHDIADPVAEALGRAAPAMDRKAHARMMRGKLTPQARIDLHGRTLDEAHRALAAFITRAHGERKRLVLVITGKGRADDGDDPVPRRTGVLRQQVPAWLRAAPLAGLVLEVARAHQRHGGAGAYYVYLRRPR